MEKQKKEKKILIVVLLLVIIVMAIYFGNIFRKMNIIRKYNETDEFCQRQNNIYVKMEQDGGNQITETWLKDNKFCRATTTIDETNYIYDDSNDEYSWVIYKFKSGINKVTKINGFKREENGIGIFPLNTDNLFEEIKQANNATIKKVECDGKDSYEIKIAKNLIIYVSTEDYMPIKTINGDIEFTYTYEFNTVTDEEVSMPDISSYEIID